MNITITGHQIDITDALRQLIEKKFEHIEKHYPKIISAHVVLSVQKINHSAEITMHVPGEQFMAHAKAENMYKAIDDMLEKLDRQILKHKDKLKSHRE